MDLKRILNLRKRRKCDLFTSKNNTRIMKASLEEDGTGTLLITEHVSKDGIIFKMLVRGAREGANVMGKTLGKKTGKTKWKITNPTGLHWATEQARKYYLPSFQAKHRVEGNPNFTIFKSKLKYLEFEDRKDNTCKFYTCLSIEYLDSKINEVE